jgi:hypothetical protein
MRISSSLAHSGQILPDSGAVGKNGAAMITDREPTPEERANRLRRAATYLRIMVVMAILYGALGILALVRHNYTEQWIPYVNIGVSLCWLLLVWRDWSRAKRDNLAS